MKCEWIIQNPDIELCRKLSETHKIPLLLAKILVNRGITADTDVDAFLHPESQLFHDPFLLKDMNTMVDLLLKIRKQDEAIAIYGDYDVDGVTATALVYSVLRRLGWRVSYYIPSRLEEGYGLSKAAIMDLFHQGIRNIMTVDCGITSNAEIDYANFLKFRILITDHHEVQGSLPSASAIVNPKRTDDPYPFKGLAGVGVAFKVMDALIRTMGHPIDLMEYIDLVTLGTVADIVPLQDENRTIVTKGLKSFEHNQHIGIRRLIELSGVQPKNMSTYDIGYKIAPRLNAVGRLESAYASLKLLLSESEEESWRLAKYLDEQNSLRQTIENKIYREAERMMKSRPELQEQPILVLAKEGWHPGVIGIVSSRLTAKYYKPTLMISIDETEGVGRGSARSIAQVNIMDLFQKASSVFGEYGGHPMAAGFTIGANKVQQLENSLCKAYTVLYGGDGFTSRLSIDSPIAIKDLDDDLSRMLERILPYGQGNPEPIFAVVSAGVERVKLSGNNAQHLRMFLRQGDAICDVIGFHMADQMEDYRYIKPTLLKADTVGSIKSQWHYGVKHIQFFMKDLRLYIDPSTREEETDKKFVSDLLKQDFSANPQEVSNTCEPSGKVNKSRFLSKNPKLRRMIQGTGHHAYFGTLKVQEEVFLHIAEKMLQNGTRLLVIGPSNLFLSYRYETLKRLFKPGVCAYFNSLSTLPSVPPPISFATSPMVSDHFDYFRAGFQCLFLMDLEFAPPKQLAPNHWRRVFHQNSNMAKHPIFLLGSHLSPGLGTWFEDAFQPQSMVVEHIKNPHKGIVDRRDCAQQDEYIQKLVMGSHMVMVLVNSGKKSIELTKSLGRMLSGQFHNGEVVFYHPRLSGTQRRKIEDLVTERKVRLLITTPHFGLNMQLPEESDIILYHCPQSPTEIYAINSLLQGNKKPPIIHLLYRTDQSQNAIDFFDTLFPDQKKVENMVQLVCANGVSSLEEIRDSLIQKGNIPQQFWKVYHRIFTDLEVIASDGRIQKGCSDLSKRISSLVRVQEGALDREFLQKSVRMFHELSPKEILGLMGFPFSCYS